MTSRLLVSLFILSCSTEVGIIGYTEKEQSEESAVDTSQAEVVGPDTAEQQSDLPEQPSELTVAFAEMHFRQVACQACLGVSSEFQFTAEFRAHYPTSGDYTSHLPAVGTCTTNVYETSVGVTPLPATQPVSFNDIQLYPSGQGVWTNVNLYEYQYQRSAPYTIVSEHGTLSAAFTSLEGFDDIQPYTLLWVDPSYAYDAVISRSGTTFTWTPVIPDSQFEVIVAVYSSDGSTFLGAVSCMENDSGYLTIPGTYLQSFPAYSITAVHLIRHRQGMVESQELGGAVQTHRMWEVIGTGHME